MRLESIFLRFAEKMIFWVKRIMPHVTSVGVIVDCYTQCIGSFDVKSVENCSMTTTWILPCQTISR